MTTTATTAGETSAEQVIAAAIHEHEIETGAAVRKLQLAVEWVRLHPGDEVDTSVEWGMRELEIAGDGAPTVDEGAVAEFALAIGHSTDSGRRYLGDAVELAHRLPRIWARVLSGEVAVWKARRIAQATMSLPMEGRRPWTRPCTSWPPGVRMRSWTGRWRRHARSTTPPRPNAAAPRPRRSVT